MYERLTELFKNATTDTVLDGQLRDNQVVFFLHLLGLDTTGHSYRPHSRVRRSCSSFHKLFVDDSL